MPTSILSTRPDWETFDRKYIESLIKEIEFFKGLNIKLLFTSRIGFWDEIIKILERNYQKEVVAYESTYQRRFISYTGNLAEFCRVIEGQRETAGDKIKVNPFVYTHKFGVVTRLIDSGSGPPIA